MKRYLLFMGSTFDVKAHGGWEDFVDSYHSIGVAVANASGSGWWHVVDSTTGKIVRSSSAL